MKCIELVIKNAPVRGEYKVVNQFANIHSINELALKVKNVCNQLNIHVEITKMKNPRKESEKHYYNPDNQNLKNLGYIPSTNFEEEILKLIVGIRPFKNRISRYSEILNP